MQAKKACKEGKDPEGFQKINIDSFIGKFYGFLF